MHGWHEPLDILLEIVNPSVVVFEHTDERIFALVAIGLFAVFAGIAARRLFPSSIAAALASSGFLVIGLVTNSRFPASAAAVMYVLGSTLRFVGGCVLAGAFRRRIRLALIAVLAAVLFAFLYTANRNTLGPEFMTFVKLLVIAMFLARLYEQAVSLRDRHPGSGASAAGLAILVIMASIVNWESAIGGRLPHFHDQIGFLLRNSFLAGILAGGCVMTLKALGSVRAVNQ